MKRLLNGMPRLKNKNDAQFGRHTGMRTLDTAPILCNSCCSAVHYTMGGIHIDKETHVLDENGNIIPGLFAAGGSCWRVTRK